MHKLLLCVLLILTAGKLGAESFQAAPAVRDSLAGMGMEEIRIKEADGVLYIAYEDNVYRGTVRGLGAVIGMLLSDEGVRTDVHLVILEECVPQIYVHIPQEAIDGYRRREYSWQQLVDGLQIGYDTDEDMRRLTDVRAAKRSAGKVDIVLYPEVMLNNAWLDKLYGAIVNISPAVEVGLWRGASFTGQVIFPIWNNMKGEMDYIRPGMLVFRQEMRFPHNMFATLSAGNFNGGRIGAEVSLLYRMNSGRWAFGLDAGATGSSTFYEGKWEVTQWRRLSGSARVSYNEPRYNIEFDLRGMRFVYGDYGVRLDCTRHFGEVSVGLYAMCAGGLANGGFNFAIPLPRKKRSNRRAVRVRLPEYFDWEYEAQSGNEYFARRLGRTFETRPDENRSRAYYDPGFIRRNLRVGQ